MSEDLEREGGGLPPYQHPGPAPDRRPRAKMGVWALVLAGVGALLCLMTQMWIFALPSFLFAIWAVIRIRPEQQRGQGLAIMGAVLSLAVGGFVLFGAGMMRDATVRLARGALSALSEGTDEELSQWLHPDVRSAETLARERARFEAVEAELGAFSGSVELASVIFGAAAVVVPPLEATEVGTEDAVAATELTGALWAKARFGEATVHVGLRLEGGSDLESVEQLLKLGQGRAHAAVLAEVRYFADP